MALRRHRRGGGSGVTRHRVHYVIEAPAVFFGHTPLQIAATFLLPAAVGGDGLRAMHGLPRKRTISGHGRPIDPMPVLAPCRY